MPVPAGWLPAVRLGYRRTRWVCPCTGTRVALDRDVAASAFHPLLFPAARAVRLPVSLVEWKNGDGAPPPWAETIFRAGYRLRSHSKYAACIERLRTGT